MFNWIALRDASMRSDARLALDSVGMGDVDETAKVAGMPVGYMQFVECAREVDKKNARLIVFDEPTIIEKIESFKDYDKNIEIVTMDMACNYRAYVHECLPNAHIIIDKFHVFKELNEITGKTKTRVVEHITEKLRQEPDSDELREKKKVLDMLNHNTYLFKFGPEKLQEKPERLLKLADICRTFPEFNRLRLLKEGFENIYDCVDRESAEAVFADWCKMVPPSGSKQKIAWEKEYEVPADLYEEFRRIKNTVKRLSKEIFNYFEFGCCYTNAATEGLNQLTGKINLAGNGYSFKRLRAKALFWHVAAPRTAYSLTTKEKPVYEMAGTRTSYSYFPTGNFGIQKTYQTVSEITEEVVEEEERKPLTVFDCFPEWFSLDAV